MTEFRVTPKLLLHSCCGPCSTSVIERLHSAYDVTVFFYNPNITDREEYEKRKETQLQFLTAYNQKQEKDRQVAFLEGAYEPEKFFRAALGLEHEREGGRRCRECFLLRLSETAKAALAGGFFGFSTTLSVSPHKSYPCILELGKALAVKEGLAFIQDDFKKQAGFQRSTELSKEYGLYRQRYCGCEFSKWEK